MGPTIRLLNPYHAGTDWLVPLQGVARLALVLPRDGRVSIGQDDGASGRLGSRRSVGRVFLRPPASVMMTRDAERWLLCSGRLVHKHVHVHTLLNHWRKLG